MREKKFLCSNKGHCEKMNPGKKDLSIKAFIFEDKLSIISFNIFSVQKSYLLENHVDFFYRIACEC